MGLKGRYNRRIWPPAAGQIVLVSLFALTSPLLLPGNTYSQTNSEYNPDYRKEAVNPYAAPSLPETEEMKLWKATRAGKTLSSTTQQHPQQGTAGDKKVQRVVLAPVAKVKALSPKELREKKKAEARAKAEARKKARKEIIEVLEWKLIMAETKHGISSEEKDRYALISAYQALIDQLCMPSLPTTLEYKGPGKKNLKCHKRIDELIELDPDNPSALCARDGIDASSCREAYSKQVSTSDPNTIARKRRRGLTGYRGTVVAHQHSAELDELETAYRSETLLKEERDALERKIRAAYSKILQASCKDIKTSVLSRDDLLGSTSFVADYYKAFKTKDYFANEDNKKNKGSDKRTFMPNDPETHKNKKGPRGNKGLIPGRIEQQEFQMLLDRFDAAAAGKVVKEEPELPQEDFYRVRLLPTRCEGMITRMLRVFPNSSLAICYRDGLFSPFCIDALRADKERAKKEKKERMLAKQKANIARKRHKKTNKPEAVDNTSASIEKKKVKKKDLDPPGIHEF